MTPNNSYERHKVLVLDDDLKILDKHTEALRQEGFRVIPTQEAEEAIEWMLTKDPSIRFALIDVILHTIESQQELAAAEGATEGALVAEPELQSRTGDAVVREINLQRQDVSYVFVTAAPKIRNEKRKDKTHSTSVLEEEEGKLLRKRGVLDVIHRYQIDRSPIKTYASIVGYIHRAYQRPFSPVRPIAEIVHRSHSIGRIQVVPRFHVQQLHSLNIQEYGTGWLIAPDIVITCWHLFSKFNQTNERWPKDSLDLYETAASSRITFNYLNRGLGVHHRFSSILTYSTDLDYVLLRLSNQPTGHRVPLQMQLHGMVDGDPELTIAHHPLGDYMSTSSGWHVDTDHTTVAYKVETALGTSGSPVFRTDNFKVIAMHTSFKRSFNYQEGVWLQKVMEDLKQFNPPIFHEIIRHH